MMECILAGVLFRQASSSVRRLAGYAVRHQKRFDFSSRGINDISIGAELAKKLGTDGPFPYQFFSNKGSEQTPAGLPFAVVQHFRY